MFAILQLAWSEFNIGFSRRRTGAPGVRDFVALAAFFGLMMFLFLLGWSVRDGLWGRIEQVLLGALPDGRPPIRLSYHIDNANKINSNVLNAFTKKFSALTIVPERSGDGEKGAVILPGLNVIIDPAGKIIEIKGPWGQSRKDKRTVPFRIEALPLDSPTWEWILRPTGSMPRQATIGLRRKSSLSHTADDNTAANRTAPLLVAASRHLFDQHFRYDLYRDSIMANRLVPCDLKRQLPVKLTVVDDLKKLILEVKENVVGPGGKRSTVPSYYTFDVLWVDSFPIPSPTALVMPLSTYEVLLLSAESQLADVHPDSIDVSGDRISQVKLTDIDLEQKGQAEFLALASCLGAVTAEQETQGPICDTPVTPMNGGVHPPVETTGTCEGLRERMPIKYPRLINNGQDLLICTGEHRRLRASEIASCWKSSGIESLQKKAPDFAQRLTTSSVSGGGEIAWLGPSVLTVPCKMLSEQDFKLAQALAHDRRSEAEGNKPENSDVSEPAWLKACQAWNSTSGSSASGGPKGFYHLVGYQDVTVFPRSSGSSDQSGGYGPINDEPVNKVIQDLLAWETMLGRAKGSNPVPVFSLNQEYESALVRFGVLSLIIEKVSLPLALGSLALYLSLTIVILSTATAHRRRQYGLLLMTGLTPAKISYIVALQILFSCLVGGIAGVLLFEITLEIVNTLLAQSAIMNEARLLIGLDVPTFLSPITVEVTLLLWIAMLFLAVAIGMLIIYLQGILTARAPIELVKS